MFGSRAVRVTLRIEYLSLSPRADGAVEYLASSLLHKRCMAKMGLCVQARCPFHILSASGKKLDLLLGSFDSTAQLALYVGLWVNRAWIWILRSPTPRELPRECQAA